MPSSFEFRVPEKLPMPSLATRPLDAETGELNLKADKTITITGGVLATGGGSLAANRVITVPKATGAEAAAGTDDTKAVTPLALVTPLANLEAELDARIDLLEGSIGASLPTPPSIYGLLDANDNAAMTLDVDGTIRQSVLVLGVLNSMPVAEILRRIARKPRLRSSISHRISYGQSLALGNGSTLHNLPGSFYDSLMFNANGTLTAGPRAQEGSGTVAQNHATLINYEERPTSGSSPTGNFQTPLGTAIRMIKRLLIAENNIQPTDAQYTILGSAPGQSNTSIAGLSKGQAPYTRLIDDVTHGLARALELGKSYAVDAVYWSQGEADITGGTTRATYATRLQTLYTDLNTDIKAITGQAHDIKLIGYQCSEYDQANPNIALAQLDVATNPSYPNVILATANYAVEHLGATNVHLTGFGYATLGAYYGYADKRVVIDGETWAPFWPTRVTRQDRILDVEFPDTGYPLVIDDALFPTQAFAGFSAVNTSLVDNPVVHVSVVAPNRIKVGLTTGAAGWLRYGFASWGGNLRDSNPLDIQAERRKPLYAPCLTFEKAFT